MTSATTMLCHYCGNGRTADQPLAWDEDGYLEHEHYPPCAEGCSWNDAGDRCACSVAWDEADEALVATASANPDDYWDDNVICRYGHASARCHYAPCPPIADGWVRCDRGYHAVPAGEALVAETRITWDVDDDGRRDVRTVRVEPPSATTPPFWLRLEREIVDVAAQVPERTRGVIFEAKADGSPYIACRGCAEDWPEGAPRRRPGRSSSTSRDDSDELGDQSRADAVPADEELDIKGLMSLWGLADRATRDLARRLVRDGLLAVEEVPMAHGGSSAKRYRRVVS